MSKLSLISLQLQRFLCIKIPLPENSKLFGQEKFGYFFYSFNIHLKKLQNFRLVSFMTNFPLVHEDLPHNSGPSLKKQGLEAGGRATGTGDAGERGHRADWANNFET